jgi:predicted nucleotidyltransferase component of viral defense system
MQYKTPAAFRRALEERLGQRERETGEPLVRMRKRLVFERCMVRLQKKSDSPWIVKGGFALELRLGMRARMTKDLDLGVDLGYFGGKKLSPTEVAQQLRDDLGEVVEDGFAFVVPQAEERTLPIPGVQAHRFTGEARLDGREFDKIKVDIGIGDPLIPPLEELKGSDLLSFAGISPPRIRATSRAQHLAEKVHALTRPFDDRINTRVKDLVDIMLLMDIGLPDPPVVQGAVAAIFASRQSHAIPQRMENPPVAWVATYTAVAENLHLRETTLDIATTRLNDYWKTLFP